MGEVITIGLDIAKSIFQVHGVDEAGAILIRKRISRAKMLEFFANLKPCLVGIEACPAAHHWGRELQALGHAVKLMPPSYVKAYLKRSKNDANDAAAICEAVTRPAYAPMPPAASAAVPRAVLRRRVRRVTPDCHRIGVSFVQRKFSLSAGEPWQQVTVQFRDSTPSRHETSLAAAH